MPLARHINGPKTGQTTRVPYAGWEYEDRSGGKRRIYRAERRGAGLVLRMIATRKVK